MDYETLDVLYHSRKTILEILEGRGFNITPFSKFGPFEIGAMAAASTNEAFRMDLERPAEAATDTGKMKCRVEFTQKVKLRLAGYMNAITSPEESDPVDPETTELIVLTLEPIVDAFHSIAATYMATKKMHVSFFQAHTLVQNPLKHVLVPKHEIVPRDTHTEFLKSIRATSKAQLPLIRFHEDMIARIMSLSPGDIVKITRPSPSAGVYTSYRVCVP
jgi:DNA-directed RNA polymerases I, II, and III subunit RPABC1